MPAATGVGMLALMNETTPAIQDYLGAIYDLAGTDKPVIGARLARHMHVSAPSITEAPVILLPGCGSSSVFHNSAPLVVLTATRCVPS